jgi:hypothetical protein
MNHYPNDHPFSRNFTSGIDFGPPAKGRKRVVLTQPPVNARANIAPPVDQGKKLRQRKAAI